VALVVAAPFGAFPSSQPLLAGERQTAIGQDRGCEGQSAASPAGCQAHPSAGRPNRVTSTSLPSLDMDCSVFRMSQGRCRHWGLPSFLYDTFGRTLTYLTQIAGELVVGRGSTDMHASTAKQQSTQAMSNQLSPDIFMAHQRSHERLSLARLWTT
jgi:hypothetical protein